ncbi:MAG TPA: multicopper oxidase domain-containing protein [Gemmatimonadaceae bacterium]|nr:multicopper oxidase domain-containing protein [Gemmatimonadaceae bacterium]
MYATPVLAALGCFLLANSLNVSLPKLRAPSSETPARIGRIRVYYVGVDEVDWTFVPARADQALTGAKDDFGKDPASRGTRDPNATTYRKALFREYTDSSFRSLKPRDDAWKHLGILGPLIRAEVGDTIKVVLRNNATRPYSLHPHGVFYRKDSEGTAYLDSTKASDKRDDAVPPHGNYTYTWAVPERAGPAEGDGSTAFWLYHSHVDEGKDINSGLIGPMIITRRGMARPDGSPKDYDREFVADFGLFDETLSWLWDTNVKRLYGDPKKYDDKIKAVREFHHFFAINGFLEGNGPMFTMREGERVRWYLFTNPNEQNALDIHSPHWHGQTAVVAHMRTDMIMLTPMMTSVADMVPDNPGVWLFHCHMPGHFGAGMYARFNVLPAKK